jgi:hypothetical protein
LAGGKVHRNGLDRPNLSAPVRRVTSFTRESNRLSYHDFQGLSAEAKSFRGRKMTAIGRVLARAFSETSAESECSKQIVLFCAVGLLVSVLVMIYGVDLSVGFF